MPKLFHYRLALVSLALLLAVALSGLAKEPTQADLAAAIEQLASDVFRERDQACQQLLAGGIAAIPLLEEAVKQPDAEVVTRALGVLEQLALESPDHMAREQAVAAVTRLAGVKEGGYASRAETLLEAITAARRSRAIEELAELGAKFDWRPALVGPGFVPAEFALEIGDQWRGTDDDLQRLSLVSDLRVVSLSGDKFTDATLERVVAATALQSLTLKKTKVTASGLKRLKSLPELQVLDVLYTPLADVDLVPLADMRQLSLIRLFGTKVSRAAAEKLATALPNAKVDRRQGGFLGIGVQPHPLGCIISNVQPNSAAAGAGIEVGDIVLSLNDKRVGSFEDLTAVIGEVAPTEAVTIELYRGDRRQSLKIKLGEWD